MILIVAPWSGFWWENSFVRQLPSLQPLVSNVLFRGGVSVVGVVTTLAGVAELGGLLRHRAARRAGPPEGSPPAEPPRKVDPTY